MAIDTLKQAIEKSKRNIRWKETDVEKLTKEIEQANRFIEHHQQLINDLLNAVEVLERETESK